MSKELKKIVYRSTNLRMIFLVLCKHLYNIINNNFIEKHMIEYSKNDRYICDVDMFTKETIILNRLVHYQISGLVFGNMYRYDF